MTNFHFNIYLDTKGVEAKDGSKSVILSFMDKETGNIDIYPIPLEMSKDLGEEIVRIANCLEGS